MVARPWTWWVVCVFALACARGKPSLESSAEQPTGLPLERGDSHRLVGYYLLGPETVASYPESTRSIGELESQGTLGTLTHLVVAFAGIDVEGGCDWLPGTDAVKATAILKELAEARDRHPNLKTMIAVGGWMFSHDGSATSGRFPAAAATEASRAHFARTCAAFVAQHRLDGVDLDWEFPGRDGNGAAPFTALLDALRKELATQGTPLLTIASSGSAYFLSRYYADLADIAERVDFINVMAYDFNGPWGGVERTNFNAHLYGVSQQGERIRYSQRPYPQVAAEPLFHNALADPSEDQGASSPHPSPYALTTESAVQQHLLAGVPPDKVVLGVPFYGRAFAGVSNENSGLYQTFERFGEDGSVHGVLDWLVGCESCVARHEPAVATYRDIVAMIAGDYGYEQHVDPVAGVPWLVHPAHKIFLSYEDPSSMSLKARFVVEHGLGGMMIWHLDQDDREQNLLNAIAGELKKDN